MPREATRTELHHFVPTMYLASIRPCELQGLAIRFADTRGASLGREPRRCFTWFTGATVTSLHLPVGPHKRVDWVAAPAPRDPDRIDGARRGLKRALSQARGGVQMIVQANQMRAINWQNTTCEAILNQAPEYYDTFGGSSPKLLDNSIDPMQAMQDLAAGKPITEPIDFGYVFSVTPQTQTEPVHFTQ